jgi:uncharacterized membrane protein YbhN (UPF0104 family)
VPRLRRAGLHTLRVAGTAAVVAYVLTRVSPADLLAAMARVNLVLLAAAAVLYLLGQALSAVRWGVLGRAVGVDRPLRDYLRFYAAGMFFNLFGPSTLGGDAVRAWYLGHGRRRGLAAATVLFDRASGLATLVALAAAALLALRPRLPRALSTTVVVAGSALFVTWLACPRLVRVLPREHRVRRVVEHDLAPFWRDGALLAWAAGLSLVFHVSQVAVQWVLGRALGVALPFAYCLVFHPLVVLLTALPVSLGGFGVREAGYVWLLGPVGVAPSAAVALSLLWFAVTAAAGLVGGLVLVRDRRRAAVPPV